MAAASPEDLEKAVDDAERRDAEEREKRRTRNPLGEEHLRKQIPREEDPDRKRMLDSYEKLHHRTSVRMALLEKALGQRIRVDFMRGPAASGILRQIDEDYGEIVLETVEHSPGNLIVLNLRAVHRVELFRE